MTAKTVMLLIDADNVSVEVMEQAVERLLAEHGALHVRRAYCSAESANKHQDTFKRLAIRPMVNLAAGKNSTDIALAVDALDLVIAERPAVVVIASSDSDFAPLVSRLREKGCRVCGIGQQGKTGSETEAVYDEFVQFAGKAPRAARKTATRRAAAVSAPAAEPPPPLPPAAAPRARKTSARKTAAGKTAAGKTTSAAKAAPRRTATRKTAAATPVAAPTPAPTRLPPPPAMVQQLLHALPGLARGERLELQRAAEVLRRSGELSRRSTAQKLFGRFPDWFELLPAADPRWVTVRAPHALS